MTTNTDPVRALIEKWRGTHGSGFTSQGEFQAHLSTLRTCADELEAALVQQPAAAEPKTLPVPTRVYLTDNAAVIAGHPQRGWDEDGPDAHNCDAMGCAPFGRHVLARVPFTDERAPLQAENERLRVALYELRERCAQECERLASSQCNTSIGEAWKLGALACADEIRAMTLAKGGAV